MNEPSYLNYKDPKGETGIKVYANYDGCERLADLPIDLITSYSDDFLGIREANITMINWNNQLEIGAALALRKKVITVGTSDMKIHPLIIVFPTWEMAYRYIRNAVIGTKSQNNWR
jgi:hypothetical protein